MWGLRCTHEKINNKMLDEAGVTNTPKPGSLWCPALWLIQTAQSPSFPSHLFNIASLHVFPQEQIYLINKENVLSSSDRILLSQEHLERIHALLSKIFHTVSREKHRTGLLWRAPLLHTHHTVECGKWAAEKSLQKPFCEMVYGTEYEHM